MGVDSGFTLILQSLRLQLNFNSPSAFFESDNVMSLGHSSNLAGWILV